MQLNRSFLAVAIFGIFWIFTNNLTFELKAGDRTKFSPTLETEITQVETQVNKFTNAAFTACSGIFSPGDRNTIKTLRKNWTKIQEAAIELDFQVNSLWRLPVSQSSQKQIDSLKKKSLALKAKLRELDSQLTEVTSSNEWVDVLKSKGKTSNSASQEKIQDLSAEIDRIREEIKGVKLSKDQLETGNDKYRTRTLGLLLKRLKFSMERLNSVATFLEVIDPKNVEKIFGGRNNGTHQLTLLPSKHVPGHNIKIPNSFEQSEDEGERVTFVKEKFPEIISTLKSVTKIKEMRFFFDYRIAISPYKQKKQSIVTFLVEPTEEGEFTLNPTQLILTSDLGVQSSSHKVVSGQPMKIHVKDFEIATKSLSVDGSLEENMLDFVDLGLWKIEVVYYNSNTSSLRQDRIFGWYNPE